MKIGITLIIMVASLCFGMGIGDYFLLGSSPNNPSLNSDYLPGFNGEKFNLSICFGMQVQSEERSSIVYDSYDNRMGENVFATASNTELLPRTFIVSYRAYGTSAAPIVRIGLTAERIWQGTYKMRDETRETTYQTDTYKDWKVSGELYKGGLLLSTRIFPFLDIELCPGYVMGTLKRSYSIKEQNTAEKQTSDELKAKGIGLQAGIRSRFLEDVLEVHASYALTSLKADVEHRDFDNTSAVERTGESWKLPATASMTLKYSPPSYFTSKLEIGIDYTFWSKYEVPMSIVPDSLNDTWTAHLSVSHNLKDNMAVDANLAYSKSPLCSSLDFIHIGIGAKIRTYKDAVLRLEYGHSFQNFSYTDIEPYAAGWYKDGEEISFQGSQGQLNVGVLVSF